MLRIVLTSTDSVSDELARTCAPNMTESTGNWQ